MCAVNLVSAEPPSHTECARFAAVACPFMSRPKAQYRSANIPQGATRSEFGLDRNPGVTLLWTTRTYEPFKAPATATRPKGEWLFRLGKPTYCEWYAEGRTATRAEVMESINTGLPALRSAAEAQGAAAVFALGNMVGEALKLVPA
jgi:hypothetical protein